MSEEKNPNLKSPEELDKEFEANSAANLNHAKFIDRDDHFNPIEGLSLYKYKSNIQHESCKNFSQKMIYLTNEINACKTNVTL